MPGLKQLEQFNSDMEKLGNEKELRTQRAEHFTTIPIPESVKDIDDSADFITHNKERGEAEDSSIEANSEASNEEATDTQEEINANVPDISNLFGEDSSKDASFLPDLSDFEDTTSTDNNSENKDEGAGDNGDLYNSLLGGLNFDDVEKPVTEDKAESIDNISNEDITPLPQENVIDSLEPPPESAFSTPEPSLEVQENDAPISIDKVDTKEEDTINIDDILGEEPGATSDTTDNEANSEQDNSDNTENDNSNMESVDLDSLLNGDSSNETPSTPEEISTPPIEEVKSNSKESAESKENKKEVEGESINLDDLDSLGLDNIPDTGFDTSNEDAPTNTLDTSNTPIEPDTPIEDVKDTKEVLSEKKEKKEEVKGVDVSDLDSLNLDDIPDAGLDLSQQEEEAPPAPAPTPEEKTASADSFDEINLDDIPDAGIEVPKTQSQLEEEAASFDNVSIPDTEDEEDEGSDFEEEEVNKLEDIDLTADENAQTSEESATEGSTETPTNNEENNAVNTKEDGTPSLDNTTTTGDLDLDSLNDMPSISEDSTSTEGDKKEEASTPSPDLSEDLGETNFEIPGFSNIEDENEGPTPPTNEESAQDKTEEPASAAANKIDENLPPNTLSNEEYDKFLHNFENYPLNVKIAVEELFLKNEFTDDTQFEVIKKIVNKAPARKLAGDLEKMLDIQIAVPKDFEKRSSEEYELYKASFQYQLFNKIIPMAITGVIGVIVCILLFIFSKNCIYKPLKASSLYKTGYEHLQNNDYPQSEDKFIEATKYKLDKKWFYKYAEGYREHKQYIRAENMYKRTLRIFNQDKTAGLEYARMEMEDLANYEKAKTILLRELLDYYVNDKDALLMLGDNYLEWATERDPSKFIDAKKQYDTLLELYGKKEKYRDVYLARKLRYYVRTDNLLKTIENKDLFMLPKKEKLLTGKDWTELSGFLLDKLYGPLEPNDEYLRTKINDVKKSLINAIKYDNENPVTLYNLSRYYMNMHQDSEAKNTLDSAIKLFNKTPTIKKADMYKYINSYKLQGELYMKDKEYLKARESLTQGISLFNQENEYNGLEGTHDIGGLYANIADIDYFISGDNNAALLNYEEALRNDYDNSLIRYKIGAINYKNNNYAQALPSFMKTLETSPEDTSALIAIANTLSVRSDNYTARAYYENLLDILNKEKEKKGLLFPQVNKDDEETMNLYLRATNNLGVTLHRLSRSTGNSSLNALAIMNLQQSLRAWDALTRNDKTLIRLQGSNLAEENIKYITSPISEFDAAIYPDIPASLTIDPGLKE